MKRTVCLLFLCILLCGCQAGQRPSDSSRDPSSRSSETTGAGQTRSDGVISLLPAPDRRAYENVFFTLPTDWETGEPQQSGELFSASSSDGKQSVNVFVTELTPENGLTAELLLREALLSLSVAWKNAGAADVRAVAEETVYLGEETKALFLSATLGGEAVFQKQLYRSQDGIVYLITVTTHGTDDTDRLLQAFHTEA